MTTTTNWRAALPLLEGHGLALLPIGAKAPERKAPVDPQTGYGLRDWQHSTGYSVAALAGMNPAHVIAIGVNTGHGGILVLDIDGASAAEWVRQRGPDPATARTWHITRNTDPSRYKLVFRLTPEQQQAFPQTKLLLRTTQGEALEIYYQPGAQVLVLGEHCKSGGMYGWVNGPADIAPPTAEWMEIFQAIQEKVQELRGKGDPSRPPRVKGISSAAGRWEASGAGRPCPICGRERSAACTWLYASGRRSASCFHGSGDLLCPQGLKAGDVITGHDGGKWAFVRSYIADCLGEKSLFVDDQPKPQRTPQPMPAPAQQQSAPTTPTADAPAVDAFRRDIKAVIDEGSSGSPLLAFVAQKSHEYDISGAQADQIRKELLSEYNVAIQAEQEDKARTRDSELVTFRRQHLTLERLFKPGPLVNAIRTVMRSISCDDFGAACTFLATVAGVTPLGSSVRGNWDTFVVPMNLYLALVGSSGSGKSPTLKQMSEMPLSVLHDEATDTYNTKLLNWKAANAGIKTADRDPLPDFIYIYVNGYTAEAADEQLAVQEAHGRGLMIYNDELSRVFESLDCYTPKGRRGIGEAQLLRMFDGAGNVEIRMKGGRRYKKCQIVVLGGLQPEIFAKMARDGDPYGTFARILLCELPEDGMIQNEVYSPAPSKTAQTAQAEGLLQDFIRTVHSSIPYQMVLSADAMRVFFSYRQESDRLRIEHSHIQPAKAVYGKRPGYILRMAGLLHLMHVNQGFAAPASEVPLETLTVAADVIDQLQAYALRAHSCIGAQADNAIHDLGEKILRAAAKAGPKGVTAREISRNLLSEKQRASYSKESIEIFFRQLAAGKHAVLDPSGRTLKLLPLP